MHNQTLYQQRKDYLHLRFALLLLSLLINYNLQHFCLLSETQNFIFPKCTLPIQTETVQFATTRHQNYDNRDRLTNARQQKREHFARLARAVKCPRFNPHLHYSVRPEYPSSELVFWDSYRQVFTIQNTLLPSQRFLVLLRAITTNSQR